MFFQFGDNAECLDDDYSVAFYKIRDNTYIYTSPWGKTATATEEYHDGVCFKKSDNSNISDLTEDFVKSKVKITNKTISLKKYAHFSFDDCTFWADLIQNEDSYSSCFQNPLLADIKELHDTYGMTVTLFCFNSNGTLDISNVPSKFSNEFKSCKDWLKFGFHGENATIIYESDMVEEITASYNKFVSAIYKMSGDYECIDRFTRLSSYKGTLANIKAIRDCDYGIKGLLSPDVKNVYPYHFFGNNEVMEYMYNHLSYFDSDNQLFLVKTQPRLERSDYDVNMFTESEYVNFLPMLELMTHETQWTANVKSKFAQTGEWLKNNGYGYSFSQNIFKN